MISPYRLRLRGYEGPLDLLVQLVRLKEADVLDVAVAWIAQDFWREMCLADDVPLEDAGAFIVSASVLMELKSRALLPGEAAATDGVDEPTTREELVRQLLNFRGFRHAANLLWEKARDQERRIPRLADEPAAALAPPATTDVQLWDLLTAFSRLLKANVVPVAEGVPRDPTPITAYMDRLDEMVREAGGASFLRVLADSPGRAVMIGKFLALLELVKLGRIWLAADPEGSDFRLLPAGDAGAGHFGANVMADEAAPPVELLRAERRGGDNGRGSTNGRPPESATEPVDASEDWPPWQDDAADSQRDPGWADFEPLLDEVESSLSASRSGVPAGDVARPLPQDAGPGPAPPGVGDDGSAPQPSIADEPQPADEPWTIDVDGD